MPCEIGALALIVEGSPGGGRGIRVDSRLDLQPRRFVGCCRFRGRIRRCMPLTARSSTCDRVERSPGQPCQPLPRSSRVSAASSPTGKRCAARFGPSIVSQSSRPSLAATSAAASKPRRRAARTAAGRRDRRAARCSMRCRRPARRRPVRTDGVRVGIERHADGAASPLASSRPASPPRPRAGRRGSIRRDRRSRASHFVVRIEARAAPLHGAAAFRRP